MPSRYGFRSVHEPDTALSPQLLRRRLLSDRAHRADPTIRAVLTDYLAQKEHTCGDFVGFGLVKPSFGVAAEAFAWACPDQRMQVLLTFQSGGGWGPDQYDFIVRYVGHDFDELDLLTRVLGRELRIALRIYSPDETLRIQSRCSELEPIPLELVRKPRRRAERAS